MKMRLVLIAVLLAILSCAQRARAQWSSDPALNLALSDKSGNDQVQPKLSVLPNNQWYVTWFDADPNSPPPVGYDVYLQRLDKDGVEQFPHDGTMIADLSNGYTEDYGMDVDSSGNALLAFLDTREGNNWQVTATKISKSGKSVWGTNGVQMTADSSQHFAPKITGTSDGGVVVAWTAAWGHTANVKLMKLDKNGNPVWSHPVVFHEVGYQNFLADLHASDNGSVIVSFVREAGFFSDKQLRANKISAGGKKMWGASNIAIFDQGSLQFGNFPYFQTDGSGGAIFAWYTAYPILQCYAQHIRADGSEAFPHNGSAGSTDTYNVRVEPSVAYRAATDETFLFWTEEDTYQIVNGVYGQKFDGAGNSQWGDTGMVLVPLGYDSQTFVKTVQVGNGPMVFWVDSPGYGSSVLQAAKLESKGNLLCAPFPVSTTPANKWGLTAVTARSGMTAVVWTDDRIGNNSIYIQNVNANCSLGPR